VRFTEIHLFGVYVASMSSLIRRPFRPDAIRFPRATQSAPHCGSEGIDAAWV
jgi:hypothetical protein